MKKLTYKGKPAKVVKKKGENCNDCIFSQDCYNCNAILSLRWEKKNKLDSCTRVKVKYIYA